MPKLIRLESVIEPKAEIVQAETGVISIGRDADNLVVIDSESISRKHAFLTEFDGIWIFKDNGSTNGSFINGIRLNSEQSRLLRHNDVVQLADFPLRYLELRRSEKSTSTCSVIVFYKGAFESNVELVSDKNFSIGGPHGTFFLQGASDEQAQLEIVLDSGRIDLSASSETRVILNGLVVNGVSALNDRDEIVIGPYTLIINNENIEQGAEAASEIEVGSSAFSSPSPLVPQVDIGPVDSKLGGNRVGQETREFSRDGVEAMLPAVSAGSGVSIGSSHGGWATVGAGGQSSEAKPYIFGSDPEQAGMSSTMSIDAEASHFDSRASKRPSSSGFEMSASQRFSNLGASEGTPEEIQRKENRLLFLGVLVLLSVVVFAAYLAKILS